MTEYHEQTEEKLTHDVRMATIRETFILKMHTLMQAHAQMRNNPDAIKMYLDECATILNERLPNAGTKDALIVFLRNTWRECTNNHTSRYFFDFALINKSASKVAREHAKYHIDPFKKKKTGQIQDQAPIGDKSQPETQGWTIEKAQAHIAETQRMIEEKEIPYPLGITLLKIPTKALERLQGQAGGDAPDFDLM